MSNRFQGVVVPMISPFTPSGAIDVPAVGRVVDVLVQGKVAGIFPLGTTGESASIHPVEKRNLVSATVTAVAGRSMVYAGISGNCFRESIELADACADMGVDALVAHMPSYYPLKDDEIESYFFKLADRVKLPLVLYNIPQTTNMSIAIDSVVKLKEHQNIVALKDSAGDPKRLTDLFNQLGGKSGFPVLLGNSSQFTHGMKLGGVGLIPSGAHLVPAEYQALFEAGMKSDWAEVERLQAITDAAVKPYISQPTLGRGLAKLKALLEARGICGRTMLAPLMDHVD